MTETQADALRALIEKVEAGTLTWPEAQAWAHHSIGHSGEVWSAYIGSLDAAKALHEALLPGWEWAVAFNGHTALGGNDQWEVEVEPRDAAPITPARSWLLAILRARLSELSAPQPPKGEQA